jgi:hypothetical protein
MSGGSIEGEASMRATIRSIGGLWGLAAGLAAAAACGNITTPSGGGVPIGAAPMAIAQTVCPKAWSCCTASDLMGNGMAGTDEPSCETKTLDAFQKQLSAVETSQNDGRARYDGEQLDACLTYIRSSTCDMLSTTNHLAGLPGCDRFVVPLVADGGTCVYDWECTGGSCQNSLCQTLPPTGGACPDNRCAAGAACGSGGACVAVHGEGEACTEGAACTSGSCVDGTCAPRAPTCFYASGCAVAGGARGLPSVATGAVAALVALLAVRARRRGGGRRRQNG